MVFTKRRLLLWGALIALVWVVFNSITPAGSDPLGAQTSAFAMRGKNLFSLLKERGLFDGTVDVTQFKDSGTLLSKIIGDAKPAANGLSYDPDLIKKGESLLSSIGMLDYLSAPASLMTGSALSRLISALDMAAGKMSSPDNNAMEQIRRLLDRLKNGPIEIYGRLEYEMCECNGGKPKMIRQDPIKDSDEIVLDPTDRDAVRMGYNNVMSSLMRQLSAAVKAARGE